jgi:probable HAF family extracellular repeat protein
MNASGQVVGVSGSTAVEWASGATATTPPTPLGPLPGGTASVARAINASGQVVGEVDTKDASGNLVTHAVLWNAGATTPTALGTSPGITSSVAWDINTSGAVVGNTQGNGAVEWAPGATATTPPTALGLLPGATFGGALAINANGQVVGQSSTQDASGNLVTHAVLWNAGTTTPTDLGTLAGITGTLAGITSTIAWGINASGQVVGAAGTLPDGTIAGHALLWNTGMTTPTDLGALLPPGSGWVLEIAYAINDAVPVQIVGTGNINNGPNHGFRLSCS